VTSVIKFGEEKRLSMIIEGKSLNYRKTAKLVNHRIRKSLNNFDLKKPFDARVVLIASIGKREEPAFAIHFSGTNNDLLIGTSKIPYSGIAFTGRLVCVDSSHVRGDIAHAFIEFPSMTGKIYDAPFKAKVHVYNLTNPYLRMSASVDIDPRRLPFDISKQFELSGRAEAEVSYSGPTDRLNYRQFLDHPMRLRAKVNFHQLAYRPADSKRKYTVDGIATLTNKDLYLDDVSLKTDFGDAKVRGSVQDFMKYVVGMKEGFAADLTVRADSINLDPAFEGGEEKSTEQVVSREKNESPDGALSDAACTFDKACNKFEFNVRLSANHVKVKHLVAEKARCHIRYKQGLIEFPLVEMRACEGVLKAKGTINGFKTLQADVTLHDANVTRLFEQFRNFGQTAIVSDNLSGRIDIEGNFSARLTNRLDIAPETMFAELRLRLTDGELINFEPVQRLSNFLFKNRDFNRVRFSEVNESFIVRGPVVEINELAIASSVLDLFVVDGIYNFQGHSNINLLIPWANLRKRGRNFIPQHSGKSAEDTKGLRLNFAGPPNQMRLTLGHKEAQTLRASI
jgi:hypothetical protein